jgi:hypothetical protein
MLISFKKAVTGELTTTLPPLDLETVSSRLHTSVDDSEEVFGTDEFDTATGEVICPSRAHHLVCPLPLS